MADAMDAMLKPYTSSQKSSPAAPRPAAATHMLARSGRTAPPGRSHLRGRVKLITLCALGIADCSVWSGLTALLK